MKSTKMTTAVQLDQVLDLCVDVSKSKLNGATFNRCGKREKATLTFHLDFCKKPNSRMTGQEFRHPQAGRFFWYFW